MDCPSTFPPGCYILGLKELNGWPPSFLPGCCPGSEEVAWLSNQLSTWVWRSWRDGQQFIQISTWMLPRVWRCYRDGQQFIQLSTRMFPRVWRCCRDGQQFIQLSTRMFPRVWRCCRDGQQFIQLSTRMFPRVWRCCRDGQQFIQLSTWILPRVWRSCRDGQQFIQLYFYLDVAQGLEVLQRWPPVHPAFYLDVAQGLKELQRWPPVHPAFYLDVAQGLEVLLGLCVNVKSFPLRQAEFRHHPNQSPDLNGQYKLTNITAKIIIIQPLYPAAKTKKNGKDWLNKVIPLIRRVQRLAFCYDGPNLSFLLWSRLFCSRSRILEWEVLNRTVGIVIEIYQKNSQHRFFQI